MATRSGTPQSFDGASAVLSTRGDVQQAALVTILARLADLFLDTLLYYAHTTASDALWSNGSSAAGHWWRDFAESGGIGALTSKGIEQNIANALAGDGAGTRTTSAYPLKHVL